MRGQEAAGADHCQDQLQAVPEGVLSYQVPDLTCFPLKYNRCFDLYAVGGSITHLRLSEHRIIAVILLANIFTFFSRSPVFSDTSWLDLLTSASS